MAALAHAVRTLAALVVDDGVLATLVAAWVLAATVLLPAVVPGDAGRAVLLFVGLAGALVACAMRAASRPIR